MRERGEKKLGESEIDCIGEGERGDRGRERERGDERRDLEDEK